MRKLTKREKRLLAVAGLIILGYAFYWLVFSPQWADFQALQTQIHAQQQNLLLVKRRLKDADVVIRQDRLNQARDQQPVKFQPGNQGALVVRLNQLAAQNKLEIISFKPVTGPKLLLPAQTVDLEVEGPFAGIAAFLHVLETEPYFTRIEMHHLQPISGSSIQDVMKTNSVVDFRLQVFNLPGIQ